MQANKTPEVFQIAGDSSQGLTTSANLSNTALCHPVVLYRGRGMERFLTLDVFKLEGVPMYAVVYCPLCQARDPENQRNMSLTIKENNKKIDLDINAYPQFKGFSTSELVRELGLQTKEELRGRISIEAFGCTWEEDPSLKRGFGLSCCNWKVKITDNIARDA